MILYPRKTLLFLLLTQFIGLGIIFPYYTFFYQSSIELRYFSVGLSLLGLLTLASVWLRKTWALWAVLTLVSFKLTLDLYAWSVNLDRSPLLWIGELINLGIIGIAFQATIPTPSQLTLLQKIYYGCVLALAAIIGIWGLFFPANALQVLPLTKRKKGAEFLFALT